jgi:hypothetical protein
MQNQHIQLQQQQQLQLQQQQLNTPLQQLQQIPLQTSNFFNPQNFDSIDWSTQNKEAQSKIIGSNSSLQHVIIITIITLFFCCIL